MKIKASIFLLIPFFCFSQNAPRSIAEIESLFLKNNTTAAISAINSNITYYKNKPSEHLQLIRNYNLLGDVYLSKNEFEQALKAWQNSYEVAKKSIPANSIYMSEIYICFSKYYSFLIKADSSYHFAKKAMELCWSNTSEYSKVPIHKIYRQYAFSAKIFYDAEDRFKSRVTARKLLDSAMYYAKKTKVNDPIFNSDVLTDIANTYNDETIFHYLEGNSDLSNWALGKANLYYDSAITIRKRILGLKNYALASGYYLKSIAYSYNNPKIANPKTLECLQKAFCALAPDFNNLSIVSFPEYSAKFINSAFALQLFRYKIDEFHKKYVNTNDTAFLKCAYEHSKEAIKLWRKTFKELKSDEIHIALETYGNSPLISSIRAVSEYFSVCNNKSAEKDLIEWMDLVKYESISKSQLSEGRIEIDSSNFSITKIQEKLSEKEGIIEYYTINEEVYAFVISKNSCRFFPAKKYLNLNKIDSLNYYLLKHSAVKFCAYSKEIYDLLLSPFLKQLPKEVNHLIIVPHDKLSTIPFDALVLNDSKTYKNADFLINHYQISEALSSRLWLNSNQSIITSNISFLAPKYKKLTPLPFNQELIGKLKDSYNLVEFNLIDTVVKSSILHFAAHSINDGENSRLTSLLISDTEKLTLKDISKAKLNYAIAVISACETARGNNEIGEGPINFSRHFYLAGVKSTISTLWKVDDEATAAILDEFYSNLMSGRSAIIALHLAKLNYLNNPINVDNCDPYYWSGLVYTGGDLEMKRTNDYFAYLIYALLLGVLFFLIRKFFFKAN